MYKCLELAMQCSYLFIYLFHAEVGIVLKLFLNFEQKWISYAHKIVFQKSGVKVRNSISFLVQKVDTSFIQSFSLILLLIILNARLTY